MAIEATGARARRSSSTLQRWVADRLPSASLLAAVATTTLFACVDLAVNVPIAGTLAVGSCLAAIAARPVAVVLVGVYSGALLLGLVLLKASGAGVQRTEGGDVAAVFINLVAIILVTGVGAAIAGRRRRLEESVAHTWARHARLAAVVDSCRDGIMGVELDGTVTSWNDGAERLMRRPAGQVVGRDVRELSVSPAEERATSEALVRIAAGEPGPRYEMSRAMGDGSTSHMSIVWSPVHAPDGAVVGASAAFRDAAEQEAERRSLQDRVGQFERLESLGKLVGGIAHDFNNLMAIVLNYTEFVQDGTRDNPDAQEDLAHVRGAAERAAALTQQLLTFARGGGSRTDLLAPDDVVARVSPLLARSLGEDVELVVARGAGRLKVRADWSRLEQVLVNLAVNARDAMPRGGRLTIRTADVHLDEAAPGLTPPPAAGGHVLVEVTDTGVGMSAETAAHVFEPFFTTKPDGEGTGLGLATVWGIVTELGGCFEVSSQPGVGTSIRLYLPAGGAPAEHPVAAADPDTAAALRPARGRVLVVEDEAPLRELVQRVLERTGYQVVAAPDGAAAVAAASDDRFDLLLTDVVMPGMSGPEVASAVRAVQPHLPVLFTSGYSQGVLGPQPALEEGFDLLPKPFTRAGLVERVAAALDRVPT